MHFQFLLATHICPIVQPAYNILNCFTIKCSSLQSRGGYISLTDRIRMPEVVYCLKHTRTFRAS